MRRSYASGTLATRPGAWSESPSRGQNNFIAPYPSIGPRCSCAPWNRSTKSLRQNRVWKRTSTSIPCSTTWSDTITLPFPVPRLFILPCYGHSWARSFPSFGLCQRIYITKSLSPSAAVLSFVCVMLSYLPHPRTPSICRVVYIHKRI